MNAISKLGAREFGFRTRLIDLTMMAVPMVLARAGLILMLTADIVMVGHYGMHDLAVQAIGYAVVMPMIVIGLGLLMGTLVLTANYYGADRFEACGGVWKISLPYAVTLGLVGLLVTMFGEYILRGLGQTNDLVAQGADVMRIMGLGLPALFLFLTTELFLEGIHRPKPAMYVMAAANVVNVALNWMLIFGNFGAPEMGASGAAWATTISRGVAALWLIALVWRMRDHRKFAIRRFNVDGHREWMKQFRIGVASSVSTGGESLAFAAMHVFAGWLGPMALAAFSVTFNLITVTFMFSLGLGAATAVRVGHAYGDSNTKELRVYGWTGLIANSIAMVLVGLLILAAPALVAGLFTDDAMLVAACIPLVTFLAYILVIDGGQAVMANALRGRTDVWFACMVQIFCYFGLMLPSAYLFAFVAGYGTLGLMFGILVGSGVSILLLSWRFHALSKDTTVIPEDLPLAA